MNQVQVLETPIKSENDTRDYRIIKLPNGLKAILIQQLDDENSEQKSEDAAAVYLVVRVGSFDEPPHVLGLAHFLEHLMFMGCEKYPGENSLIDFMAAHGGHTNASTTSEKTSYEFFVPSKVFPEALDRFVNIFLSPLLLKEAMQREREAVESEFKGAMNVQEVLAENIYKTFIKESHPASQFDYGNLKTLKDDISDDDLHREVVKFYEKYAANRMNLAMQSKLSLDEMQALVVEKFSAIKAESDESDQPTRTIAKSLDDIFKPEFFTKMIIMKPKGATKSLRLAWALPLEKKMFRTKPLGYLSTIFTNKGEGGLSSYLRNRQWITSMNLVSYQEGFGSLTEFAVPYLNISLTDFGAQNIDQILEAVYSYLLMIQETPIEEHRRLYQQTKDRLDLNFKFRRGSDASGTVAVLSENMSNYDDVDAVRGWQTLLTFDEDLISSTIDMMNKGKFNLLMINDEHQTFDKKDKFFGTEYQEIDFPETYRKLWDERKSNAEFFLEKPNPFIATNFQIFVDEAESPKFPVKIVDDGVFEVWHKLDDKFKTPKVNIDVELFSPKVMSSIESSLYLQIYNDMLNEHLANKLAESSSAGLSAYSSNRSRSLDLSFTGYNDKMDTLIEMTVKELQYFNEHLNQSTFESKKMQNKKSFYNSLLSHSSLNSELINVTLHENDAFYFDLHLFKKVDEVTFENLQKFLEKFYANLKVKVFIHGNYRKSDAMKVVDILKLSLDCGPLDEDYELKKRSFQIPLGESVLRVKSLMPNSEDSKTCTIYEIGKDTLKTKILSEIVELLLVPKAFDFLRNKEQLGYTVKVSSFIQNGICNLKFQVESQEDKNSYAKVQQKIEIFMNEIAKKFIEELADEEFESIRSSRVERLLATPSSLGTSNSRFWSEISNEEYIFDRIELKVKVLKSLTKLELQKFFKSFTEPKNMRKLIVQVIGTKDTSGNTIEGEVDKEPQIYIITEKLTEDENVIANIEEFKNQMTLHPIVRFSVE